MSRNKEKNQQILDARRKEIIESSILIFSKKGFFNTTVDDIANELHISHGLFYHYFKNKDELFDEIIVIAKSTIGTSLLEISENYTGIEFFYKLVDTFLYYLKDIKTAFLLQLLKDDKKRKDNIKYGSKNLKDITFNYEFFKNNLIYCRLKELEDQGITNGDAMECSLILILLFDSLTYKRVNKEIVNIETKTILKSIIKQEYLND